MKMPKLSIDDSHVARVRAAVKSLPERIGECLSGWRAAQYATGAMDAAERERVEAHFASCASCAERLERVFAGLRQFDREQKLLPWIQQQIAALPERLRGFARGLALPLAADDLLPAGQFADDTAPSLDDQTADGRLRWRIVKHRHEVVVNLETDVAELEGVELKVRWGDAVEPLILRERAGHISGRAVFSKRQLASAGKGDAPRLEILPDEQARD